MTSVEPLAFVCGFVRCYLLDPGSVTQPMLVFAYLRKECDMVIKNGFFRFMERYVRLHNIQIHQEHPRIQFFPANALPHFTG